MLDVPRTILEFFIFGGLARWIGTMDWRDGLARWIGTVDWHDFWDSSIPENIPYAYAHIVGTNYLSS